MNCRPALLIVFVVACVAVVSVDRYLTTDAIALAQDANLYNIRELAQIRATQDAQVCAGYGLRVAEINAEQMKLLSDKNEQLLTAGAALLQENAAIHQCMEHMLKIINGETPPVPAPASTPAVEEDRST